MHRQGIFGSLELEHIQHSNIGNLKIFLVSHYRSALYGKAASVGHCRRGEPVRPVPVPLFS